MIVINDQLIINEHTILRAYKKWNDRTKEYGIDLFTKEGTSSFISILDKQELEACWSSLQKQLGVTFKND